MNPSNRWHDLLTAFQVVFPQRPTIHARPNAFTARLARRASVAMGGVAVAARTEPAIEAAEHALEPAREPAAPALA